MALALMCMILAVTLLALLTSLLMVTFPVAQYCHCPWPVLTSRPAKGRRLSWPELMCRAAEKPSRKSLLTKKMPTISYASVATRLRYGAIFNVDFIAYLLLRRTVKEFRKLVSIW